MGSRSRSLDSVRFSVRVGVLVHHLGVLIVPFGILGLVPATVAWATGRSDAALYHLVAAGAVLALGGAAWALGRPATLQRNEALVLTALVFPLASLFASAPLTAYGLTPMDAWFEAVSGVTTTGLSVLGRVDEAPPAFIFARAWLQWIGGLGILVLALALVVTPGASARRMGFGDREIADVAGGTRAHARRILAIYLAFTTIGVALLLVLGAGGPDAILHTLTAVSTGGFAAHDGSLAVLPGRAQVAVMALCVSCALPFSCYYRVAYQHPLRVLSDSQLRGLLLLCALGVGVLVGVELLGGRRLAAGCGELALLAVSAQTTAGFSSSPVSELGAAGKLVLITSMFVGGAIGSTAGGIKVFRALVTFRILGLLLDRASIVPSARRTLRVGGDRVSTEEVQGIVGLIAAYVLLVLASWLAFLAFGYAPLAALFEVVSAVGTVGLSAGLTGAELPPPLKAVLAVDMLLGRVEVIAFFLVCRPSTWFGRKRASG